MRVDSFGSLHFKVVLLRRYTDFFHTVVSLQNAYKKFFAKLNFFFERACSIRLLGVASEYGRTRIRSALFSF